MENQNIIFVYIYSLRVCTSNKEMRMLVGVAGYIHPYFSVLIF